jgi:hypothetical protein
MIAALCDRHLAHWRGGLWTGILVWRQGADVQLMFGVGAFHSSRISSLTMRATQSFHLYLHLKGTTEEDVYK